MSVALFTATIADYGKLKPVILETKKNKIKYKIFVTGTHLLGEYGSTKTQIIKDFGKKNLIIFKNQIFGESHSLIFRNTVKEFTRAIGKNHFDCFFIHGDRLETLAAASVLTFSKIKIAHIEGGELSGTVDEMIRHSVSKLSHIHFVTNSAAKKVLVNSGEDKKNIFITGSPDIDLFARNLRPSIEEVRKRYDIKFSNYIISFLHPVTTDNRIEAREKAKIYFETLKEIKDMNIIHFIPNNDDNSIEINNILQKKISNKKNIRILKSMRFEFYLTLLENCKFIIGNSSSAVMEAPYFNIPSVNVGDRQNNRYGLSYIINASFSKKSILYSIKKAKKIKIKFKPIFGKKGSAKKIINVLLSRKFSKIKIQKIYKRLR
jgi:UDP-N-acetylglucosamine 2-epimerase (hydrolysing)